MVAKAIALSAPNSLILMQSFAPFAKLASNRLATNLEGFAFWIIAAVFHPVPNDHRDPHPSTRMNITDAISLFELNRAAISAS